MAELVFFYGTMNCGKSTLALQIDHNQRSAGKRGLLLTLHDREGAAISSRIGLARPAEVIAEDDDLFELVRRRLADGQRVDYVICDEAQFYGCEQVEQLGRVVDALGIDVQAFGLLSDFTTRLFPGSSRLLEIADRRVELQVEALCWCGRRGTLNARTVDGVLVREGEQVVVGDVDHGHRVAYEVLCRQHHREGLTRAAGTSAPSVELTDAAPV